MAAPPAAVAETHISVVFFVGERAYKLKKPVNLGFLDFTRREEREAVCHREVTLNRRLAPDVYLGVLDVVDASGAAVDHLVEMRRMPVERRLSTLLEDGLVRPETIDDLADLLSAFHRGCPSSPAIAEAATAAAVEANWRESFEQLRPIAAGVFVAEDLARVEELAITYLSGRQPLFTRRIEAGWARDGHGDLLADDVFVLDDGPRVLDCIEFADHYRYGDVLADVCFLAMDLERLGAGSLAERLLVGWAARLGEDHPDTLAHHYLGYRAHVRAKVAAIRAAQGDTGARVLARAHLDLCLRHLEAGRVALVLVGGPPGSGKSTVASALADGGGWTVVRSDLIRKELAGVAPDAPAGTALGQQLYHPEFTHRVYAELIERARHLLAMGERVVLDASWTAGHHRQLARAVAQETASALVELRCHVDLQTAGIRLSERTERYGSDATPEVADALAAASDPWPEAVELDTSRSLEETVRAARRHLPPG